jgi:hypothetical protein
MSQRDAFGGPTPARVESTSDKPQVTLNLLTNVRMSGKTANKPHHSNRPVLNRTVFVGGREGT